MKRIAILGCENSHAKTFLNYIKDNPSYGDVSVVGVYSDDTAAAEKLETEFGVKVLSSFDAAVGNVEGLIVTARHGDSHYKFARPYIKSGIPMFIDKPITISESEAVSFMEEARNAKVRLSGGSCLKYEKSVLELKAIAEKGTFGGAVRAPVSLKNNYGNFYFYSQHLVETVLTVFGRYPRSVYAVREGDTVTAIIRYNGFTVTALFVEENYVYSAVVNTESGVEQRILDVSDACFKAEFAEFYDILSGGRQVIDYKDFIAPVFVMNAIVRSLDSGKEEAVKEYSL